MSIAELTNRLEDFNISGNIFLDSKNSEVESRAVSNRIQEWISHCPHHTFPKSERAWINTIRAQKNLRNFIYKMRPYNVMDDIMNNKPVAKMLEPYYNQIKDTINNSKYELNKNNYRKLARKIKHLCNVVVHFNIKSVYEYMLLNSIIIKRNNNDYYYNVDVFIHSDFLPVNRYSVQIFYFKNRYQKDIEDLEKYNKEENSEVDNLFKKIRIC